MSTKIQELTSVRHEADLHLDASFDKLESNYLNQISGLQQAVEPLKKEKAKLTTDSIKVLRTLLTSQKTALNLIDENREISALKKAVEEETKRFAALQEQNQALEKQYDQLQKDIAASKESGRQGRNSI